MGNRKTDLARSVHEILEVLNPAWRFAVDVHSFKELREPYIDGVEVTQAIQYYRADEHLTDAGDRGADNSVRLVATKPARVRVHVRTGIFGADTAVTGDLMVQLRTGKYFLLWTTVATLSPQWPAVVTTEKDPDYATERSTPTSTLNFVIPSNLMWGHVRIIARIWAQGASGAAPLDTYEVTVDATLQQTLRLRGVLISYNGPDPTLNATNPPTVSLAAPTLADLQATAAWTLRTNPVQSQGVFSSAGTMAWTTPLTGVATSPGGCSTEWLALNAAVAQVKTNDGNRTDVIYYGLLPAATPIDNVGGCESSGVSTGPNAAQITMAHEVGHGAGLKHGPCGTGGDPNYPAYEPYDPANTPMASLGEYGLDIDTGTIHMPGEKDYMSYCGPQWISLFHHARLIYNAKFDPRIVGPKAEEIPVMWDPFLWPWEYIPDPPPWERFHGDLRMKAQRLISLIGLVTERRELQVQSVMRVTALPTASGSRTGYVAELIGKNGNVVASAPVMRLEAHGGCGCPGGESKRDEREPFAFQALVPNVEPGAALRIVRRGDDEDTEVWSRSAPARQPRINRFEVRVAPDGGSARWEARADREAGLEFSLQYSKDRGRSWNGLAVGIRDNGHRFELSSLPSGSVIFRLLAHDGFFSAEAVSRPVELPRRAPNIAILHPQAGPPLVAGFPMRLWAAVSTAEGTRVEPESCAWWIDDEPAGRGIEVWITAPAAGTHRCRLLVETAGGKSETHTPFDTISPEPQANSPSARAQKAPSAPKPPTPRAGKKRRRPR